MISDEDRGEVRHVASVVDRAATGTFQQHSNNDIMRFMLNSEKLDALKSLAAELAGRGVTGLSVFGSRVTGKALPDSDIDIIVDYDPDSHFSLLDLVAVGRIIEQRIGIKADVMTRPGLHPMLRNRIESHAIRVY